MFRQSVICAMIAAACFGQQPPINQRDLAVVKVEKDKNQPAPAKERLTASIPRSYALVVGVSNYTHLEKSQQLFFAERDAESMFSILISTAGGNFKAENVHKLIGPKATRANLVKELEQWLPSVAKDDDRVLIYFAGHGFVLDSKAYLAPVDIRLDSVKSTAYPMDQLGSVFGSKIKGKWKVLLIDSCHSGAITPEDSSTINKSLIDLNKSLFVLSASRDRERSFESEDFGGGHGVFTYYVERGMGGAADENGDGIVTADELAEYVRINVRRETKNEQNPTSDRGSFDPNMLLAYDLAGVKPDVAPPPKQGTMVLEANLDDVEVFVDGKSEGVLKKGTPLRLPGLTPGPHTVRGVKMGYEDDGPREETVYPGQEVSVSLRITIIRRRKRAAVEEFERGMKHYINGGEANYKKAVESFTNAVTVDPKYTQAYLYLGRAENALFDNAKAAQAYRKAIEIQPDYIEARWSFAGMLLDTGSTDEAIRHLDAVIQRNNRYGEAYYLLAEAYRIKGDYVQSIEAAKRSIELIPAKAESHFWMAESLRMSRQWDHSKQAYTDYLRLSNFDSKLAGQLNYYVRGFLIGGGHKSRAAQRDIWSDLRSLAYFGICECDQKMQRLDEAISNCRKSLSYDPDDAYVHRALGIIYGLKAVKSNSLEDVATASRHLHAMLRLNPDMEEAKAARIMVYSFDQALRSR